MDIKYFPTKTGDITIEVNGYLLHSKYNPKIESEKIVDNNIRKNHLNVFFGLGNGFIVDALLKKGIDSKRVLFIEPLQELKSANKYQYDVIYGDDIELIENTISSKLSFLSRKINIICLPNYNKLFPMLYKDVLMKIKDIQNLNIVYNNTVKNLSAIWQENAIRNAAYIFQSISLKKLYQKYDCPIVIASGGPSLTKQLLKLKSIRENIILIAAGSTVNTLMANLIEPDYIITIDGSEDNFERHFKNLQVKSAELIYSSTSRYKVQQTFKNNKYAFLDTREQKFQNHLRKSLSIDLPIILGGGSVANFALSIARYLSSGPIALIGQDLAYTDGKSHAENNGNFQEVDSDFLAVQGAFESEGYYGELVVTDYSFFSMKESFENIMSQIEHPDSIYNCTEGGIKIKKMKQTSFNDFCCRFVTGNSVIKHNEIDDYNRSFKEFVLAAHKEIDIYNKISAELKSALNSLESNRLTTEFSQRILKTLDNVDKKVGKMMKQVVMERINDPITIDVMTKYEAPEKETAEERYIRVYKQNTELYERLLKATEQSVQYTNEAIYEINQHMGEL